MTRITQISREKQHERRGDQRRRRRVNGLGRHRLAHDVLVNDGDSGGVIGMRRAWTLVIVRVARVVVVVMPRAHRGGHEQRLLMFVPAMVMDMHDRSTNRPGHQRN